MNVYSLPYVNYDNTFFNHIKPRFDDINKCNVIVNKTLFSYLNNVKSQIDTCYDEWDKIKKYTNTYEFIHNIIPGVNKSISCKKPLSRSYFKMIEICKSLNLLDELPENCKTYHFAEGPGGFIQALVDMRDNKNDKYYGMTLIDLSNENVPGWNKSSLFLKEHENVIIERGNTGDGNLFDVKNLEYLYVNHSSSCDLVTGDGGFDFSIEYNNQEKHSIKLIISQIAAAISCQKKGGNLILKVFDTFTETSIDIIYLLMNLYENVSFVKPCTSRSANSEKYIICKHFRLDNAVTVTSTFYDVLNGYSDDKYISRLLDIDIPYRIIKSIEEINSIFGQRQIENISYTLQLINNKNQNVINRSKKNNIDKCIKWCKKYDVSYNNININLFKQYISKNSKYN